MIYLGSPYSHFDPKIREARYQLAGCAVADLLRRNFVVFSPVVHCHDIAISHDLPTDFQFWRNYCLHMLDLAEQFYILELDGWRESAGLTAETIHWMRTRPDEPIIYISENMQTTNAVV